MAQKRTTQYPASPTGSNALDQLVKSGALKSTMKTFGGIGGAADAMGSMMLQNQHQIVNGLKSLEKKHGDFLKENNWNGLTYSFAVTKLKNEKGNEIEVMVALLMPYREADDQLICGKPIDVKNLAQFIKMLVEGAKTTK